MEEKIVSKDEVIKLKDQVISGKSDTVKDQYIAHLQGLLNCRSMFEAYVESCHSELRMCNYPGIQSIDYYEIEQFIIFLEDPSFSPPTKAYYTKALITKMKASGCTDLWNAYYPLIQRYPWHPTYYKSYISSRMDLNSPHGQVMAFMAETMLGDIPRPGPLDAPPKESTAE